MKLLLDTHALLWFSLGDERCRPQARHLIEDPANEKWISPASHWELAIKISLGKYSLPGRFEDFLKRAIDDNGFMTLHILPRHTAALTTLPMHHRDPFDRMLIAQCIVEQIPVVSSDTAFDAYPVTRLW